MGFTEKNWIDLPGTTTPISAAALEDMERRVTDYADTRGPAANPKDYGATGDGVTDDTTAFTDTRNGAGVGGHIYVSAGTYILDDFQANVADQRWSLGPGAVLKLKSGSASQFLISFAAEGITLEGGEIDGNRANVTSDSGDWSGLVYIAKSRARVRNVYMHDCPVMGVLSGVSAVDEPVNDVVVEGCTVIDSMGMAVHLNTNTATVASRNYRITDCYAKNGGIGAWQQGYEILGGTATDSQIIGASISNCVVLGQVGTASEDIETMHMDGIHGGRIEGNYIEGSNLGISCGAVAGLLIVGNQVKDSYDYGIEVDGATNGVTVAGNVIDGNAHTSAGIVLTGQDDDCPNKVTITGNTVRNLLGDGGVGIGIVVAGSEPAYDTVITGNNLVGATNYKALKIESTTPPQYLLFANNNCHIETSGYGVLAYPAAGAMNWAFQGNMFIGVTEAAGQFIGSTITVDNVRFTNNAYFNCAGTVVTSDVTWGTGTEID